jgi:hypothetical protein
VVARIRLVREEIGQPERPVLPADDPDHLGPPTLGAGPGVEAGLHVDLLVGRPSLLDHVELACAHVLDEHAEQRAPLAGTRRPDDAPDRAAQQPAHVRELGADLGAAARSEDLRRGLVRHPASRPVRHAASS